MMTKRVKHIIKMLVLKKKADHAIKKAKKYAHNDLTAFKKWALLGLDYLEEMNEEVMKFGS